MSPNLTVIYTFDICLSVINLILLLFVFVLLFRRWGCYHKNFSYCLLQIHVALFGITFGNILAALPMKSETDRPLQKWFIPWKMGTFWSSFSGSLLEAGFYSVFLERSLATIMRKSYERLTTYWFTFVLTTLSLMYSLGISTMWHICKSFCSHVVEIN